MRPHMADDFPLLASPASHVGQVSPVPRVASEPPAGGADIADPQSAVGSCSLERTLNWRQLLVNSPPAWAASPEKPYAGYIESRGASAPHAPQFPWPAQKLMARPEPPRLPPNLRQVAAVKESGRECPSLVGNAASPDNDRFSQDEEDEISRFLSHVSMSPKTYAASKEQELPAACLAPKTPSPRRRRSREAQDDTLISTGAWTPFSATDLSAPDSAFASGYPDPPGSTQRAESCVEGAGHRGTPAKTSASPASGHASPGLSLTGPRNPVVELGEVELACLAVLLTRLGCCQPLHGAPAASSGQGSNCESGPGPVMITYEDGLGTLLKRKGSVVPKAFLLALPSLLLTTALYVLESELPNGLEPISIADVTVGQDWG